MNLNQEPELKSGKTKKNNWLYQTQGERVFLAFQGEEDFVRKSVNFAYNYGLIHSCEENVSTFGTENFCFIRTTMRLIAKTFRQEGVVLSKIRKANEGIENLDLEQDSIRKDSKKHLRKEFMKIKKDVFLYVPKIFGDEQASFNL
jgi:hypothetical protein